MSNVETLCQDALELAAEIEQSTGLIRMVPGEGTVQLGFKKTALVIAALRGFPGSSKEAAPMLSDHQRRLDASVTPGQARDAVCREREAVLTRSGPHPQPDGFVNDYD